MKTIFPFLIQNIHVIFLSGVLLLVRVLVGDALVAFRFKKWGQGEGGRGQEEEWGGNRGHGCRVLHVFAC